MELSKKQRQQIKIFKNLSLEQNQTINLFSRKSPTSQWEYLFDGSFQAGKILYPFISPLRQEPLLDIGSGNGFPGLLFSILYPEKFFYLCERNRKKAECLKWILSKADIPNAKVLCQNAEDIERSFKIILSQAALPIKRILDLLSKLLSQKGQAFLWQSSSWKTKWPKKSLFLPEVVKPHKQGNSEQVLLKVRRS